jgi:hypothetical protein
VKDRNSDYAAGAGCLVLLALVALLIILGS